MCGGKRGCGLCPVSFGLAFGLASGISMLLLGWFGWLWGVGLPIIELHSTLYHGFAPTFVGGLIGALWGLITGFIFGAILALLYDAILHCCRHCYDRTCGDCGCKTTPCVHTDRVVDKDRRDI